MKNINLSIKGFSFKLKLLKSSKLRKLYIVKLLIDSKYERFH